MANTVPKAVLYYYPKSIWSAAASGGNFDPTFLRLNPKATVPTLVVPIEKTLADEVESRYKALIETEAIIDFLDKSRSAMSRTHTTSTAPAPSLRPATFAFSTKSKTIIDAIHSEEGNPNHLTYVNARNEAALRTLAEDKLPALMRKQKALAKYISDAEQEKLHVSVKTKAFWQEKKTAVELLLTVFEKSNERDLELARDALRDRQQFYAEAHKAWEIDLKGVLDKVNGEVIGPFSLGDQLSLADLHLASWLARVVKLSGGLYEDSGDTAIGKLEAHVGAGLALTKDFKVEDAQGKTEKHSKLAAFWDAMRVRPSWKETTAKTRAQERNKHVYMAFNAAGMLRPAGANTRRPQPSLLDDYDSTSSTDSDRLHGRARLATTASTNPPRSDFLYPHQHPQSGPSSVSSTATSTPMPSRSTSPLPQFYPNASFSCTSDSENESPSDFLRNRALWWRENRRSWWSVSRRRRKRDGRILRFLKRWTRRLICHPLFPGQPITIVSRLFPCAALSDSIQVLSLILLSIFAICLTLLLIYILNPDKEPLPWRAYCSNPSLTAQFDPYPSPEPYPFHPVDASSTKPPLFPPPDLDSFSPAGIFIGVFSVDSSFERRMLVRTTWATHPRSRDGASEGDDGVGTSRTIVRFVLGQPRKDWERRIKLEMEKFNDIIILPTAENMNRGKTHTFFSWAAINAWVPPVYSNTSVSPPLFSYSNHTASPPALAPHDSPHAWQDQYTGVPQSWVRPDYVVKADDDSFVMLAELEARLRAELHIRPKSNQGRTSEFPNMLRTGTSVNTTLKHRSTRDMSESTSTSVTAPQVVDDPLIYWGYLVTNRLHKFMAGELYALSWSLVDWAAKDPAVKGVTKGAEDKQTAKWMKLHPRSSEIRWVSERCWIYDHPRSGTVYSHGFLYPSEAVRIRRSMMNYMDKTFFDVLTSSQGGNLPPTPAAWAYSTVSTFGVRYVPPLPDLSIRHSVEALVEGSDMSMIREGSPMSPDYAWTHREGRRTRYEGKRVGGTVVVHFIKKNIWYLETALALLDGEEQSEFEKFQSQEIEKALARTPTHSHMTRRTARTQHRLS
ncbi:hypothetical protein C0995_008779 [Termitomyces sp. Mi166|nr:hypothetical protein C0995_008779 [Termitomyces sp. Mi166\